MTATAPARRQLTWRHGTLEVQLQAGMLGPVEFLLADGRRVSPLHVAPWHSDPQRLTLPAILQTLRGEWPCVPFGADAPRQLPPEWQTAGESFEGAEVPHGWSSNCDWQWLPDDASSLALECTYPESHPIARLRRHIRPHAQRPAVSITLEVLPRRECRLPIGLHPTFRVPPTPGALQIEAGRHGKVFTFPGDVEPGASRFPPNAVFENLQAVTRRGGGPAHATSLPLDGDIEDLLQLAGCDGHLALNYVQERFRAKLSWDAADFPSLLLWFSNRGRRHYPWNGTHLALGAEPVCSAFDLGPKVSTSRNPISESGTPTAMAFKAAEPRVFHLEIGAEATG